MMLLFNYMAEITSPLSSPFKSIGYLLSFLSPKGRSEGWKTLEDIPSLTRNREELGRTWRNTFIKLFSAFCHKLTNFLSQL